MFRIKEDISGGLKRITLQDQRSGDLASIVPGFGANVNELVLSKNGVPHAIIDGNRSVDAFYGKNVFKGAKLIPFPNRLKGGTYIFGGKQYRLDLNYPEENNACHGFIYDKQFTIEKSTAKADHASVTLVYHYDGFLPGYPFDCMIELEYTLAAGTGFRCHTCIKNLDRTPMPVGDGWHPFFTFYKKIDDALLCLPARKKVETDERLIPTGELSACERFNVPDRIGAADLDTCFALVPDGGTIRASDLYDGQRDINIRIWQETGKDRYNYLQVYIPPERDSIAIEPMTCSVNAFNTLEGLIVLESDGTFDAAYGVQLT